MKSVHTDASVIVTETVSDALGEPVEALPPLADAIDTDGLNAVMTGDGSHDVRITFSYAGLFVFVRSDATVYVRPQRPLSPELHV